MTLTSVKKDTREASSETRKHPVLRTTFMICAAFAVVALAVLVLGAMSADESDAAVGDTFDVGDFTYKVVKDSDTAHEVAFWSVTTSGHTTITIPDTVEHGEPAVEYKVVNVGISDINTSQNVFTNTKGTLTSVYLGVNIKVIGRGSFSGCSVLERVVPTGNDTTAKTVILPEGVTYVYHYAFDGCAKIESITLPESLGTLYYSALRDCNKLKTINFNCTNCSYGSNNSYNLSNVANIAINIGPNVTKIPAKVFNGIAGNCSFPSGNTVLTEIGESAFSLYSSGNCKIRFDLPSTVRTIGSSAFSNAIFLDGEDNPLDVTIPASVTSIGGYAFANATMGTLTIATTANATSINPNPQSVVFADNVTNIYAGWIGPDTTSVTIGSSVQKIWDGALSRYCTGSSSVTNASNVSEITIHGNDRYVIVDNVLYDSDKTVVYKAFGDDPIDTVIPDTVTKYDYYAFARRTIASLTLSAGATKLSTGMFNLAVIQGTLVIPSGVSTISGESSNYKYAFEGATFSEDFAIPSTVTSMYSNSFKNAVFEKSLTIAGTVGNTAFTGATIHALSVEGTATIGQNAFSGATILSLSIGGTKVDTYAFTNANISNVTIAETVVDFGAHAFENSSLYEITIPSGAKIGDYAFAGTDLVEVVIPASFVSIGSNAFYDCTQLWWIDLEGEIDTTTLGNIGDAAFDTRYSTDASMFSMKVTGDADSIAALQTAGKFGSTPVNQPPENPVYELQSDRSGVDTIAWHYYYEGNGNYLPKTLVFSKNNSTTEMSSYSSGTPQWEMLKKFVEHVVVDDTITSISVKGMSNFPICKTLTIGSSVKTISGIENYPQLTEMIYRATSAYDFSSSATHFKNLGTQSNGFTVLFKTDDSTQMNIPAYMFPNTQYGVNLVGLDFDIVGNLLMKAYCLSNVSNVTSVRYNVGGTIDRAKNGMSPVETGTYLMGSRLINSWPTLVVESLQLTVGNRMTSIPDRYYAGYNVTSVLFEDGCTITAIPDSAFLQNEYLTAIDLPDGCTSIGVMAFYGCTSLQTVTGVDSLTSIGNRAFNGCSQLQAFDLSNVQTIDYMAFYGCHSFAGNVDFSSLTSLGYRAFSGTAETAPQLGIISNLNNLTEIGYGAFNYSGASGDVELGSNCHYTYYDDEGFFVGCAITSFTINNSSNAVPAFIFKGLTSDFALHLKQTPRIIGHDGQGYFADTDHLTAVVLESGFNFNGQAGDTTLQEAFRGCTAIQTLTVNRSGVQIGNNAFRGCTGLTNIVNYGNISGCLAGAFYDCTNLFADRTEPLVFENCILQLGSLANTGIHGRVELIGCTISGDNYLVASVFSGCAITYLVHSGNATTAIQSIMLGNTAEYTLEISGTSIPDVRFTNTDTNLTAVIIGETVTTAGSTSRFSNCVGIETIEFNATAFVTLFLAGDGPFSDLYAQLGETQTVTLSVGEGVTFVPDNIFSGFAKLVGSISIPDNATVGINAFKGCGITALTLGDSVTLNNNAFSESKIASISMGKIKTWGTAAFKDCKALAAVTVRENDGNTQIGNYAFSGCSALMGFAIPSTVTSIGNYAFNQCTVLSGIQLPSGLQSIGMYAFSECSAITAISIPLSVNNIGASAFASCSNLATLEIEDWESPNEPQKLYLTARAFSGTKISQLTIPERAWGIGTYTFSGTKLTSLDIPSNITEIISSAFSGTTQLTQITMHGIVNDGSAENYKPFAGAGSADGLVIIISVGDSADITLPAYQFADCGRLTELQFTGRSLAVGSHAFDGCSKLTAIPDNTVSIGESAFVGCTSLTEAELTCNVGYEAFSNSGLTTVSTIGSVSLGVRCFEGCSDLEVVILSEGTTMDTLESTFSFLGWSFQDTEGNALARNAISGKSFYRESAYTMKECYSVSFDVRGHADSIAPQVILPSSPRAVAPVITGIDDGYEFDGKWYYNDVEWNFSDSIVGNMTLVAGIMPRTYTINIDGGDYGTTTLKVTYDSDATVLGSIVRTGYDVRYLMTALPDGNVVANVYGGNATLVVSVGTYTDASGKWIYDIPSTETLTFYIQWAPISYSLDLIAGEGGVDGTLDVLFDGEITDYDDPTKAGNSPEGFYIESTFGTKVVGFDDHGQPYLEPGVEGYTDSKGKWIRAERVDLYVKWETMKIYITLNVSGEPDDGDGYAIATYGESNLQITHATRPGYVLVGYYLPPETTIPLISAEGGLADSYRDLSLGDLTDSDGIWISDTVYALTLIADWTPIEYTICFNGNGTIGSMDPLEMTYDVSQALTANTFVRTGYTFAGWNTNADGSGNPYTDGQSVSNLASTQDATVTLYAQWDPITYTVIFDRNGGSGNMDSQEMTYDQSQNLTANAFEKTGYAFAGWKLSAEAAAAVYQDKESVSNLADTQDAEVTLYAHWTPNTYTITLDNGEGTGPGSVQVVFDGSLVTPPVVATRPGYDFVGYFFESTMVISGSGYLVASAGQYTDAEKLWVYDGDVTLVARWDETTYTLQLENAGGSGGNSVNVRYHGNLKPDNPMTLPTRNGYDFAGYFAGEVMVIDEEGYLVDNNAPYTDADGKWQIIVTEPITLTAHWDPKTYNIVLVSGEGEEYDGTATVTFGATGIVVTKVPTKTGYLVDSYLVGSLVGQTIANADGSFGGRTIADWTKLGKWCRYEGDMSIYAGWIPREYTVTLDPNGGTATTGTYSIYFDESTSDAGRPAKPTREGYTFTGFFTAATGGDRVFNENCDGQVGVDGWTDGAGHWINAGESQTLYAHWTAEEISVRIVDFDTGEDNGYLRIYFDATEAHVYSPDHGRPGYKTGAWFADAGCLTEVIDKDRHTLANVQGWTDSAGKWKVYSDEAVLYIKWELVTTPIVLYADDSSATDGSAVATYSHSELTSYVPASKTGYSLTGYYTSISTQTQETLVIDANGAIVPNTLYADADGKWIGTSGFTVYLHAGWQINQYTITFMVDDIELASTTGYYGFPVEGVPSNPTKDGYAFIGWDKDVPTTYPAENMTITSLWALLPTPTTDSTIDFNVPGADTVVIDTDVPAIADALDDATKTEVKVEGDGWNMVLPKEIVKDATGAVSMGAKVLTAVEIDALPQAVKEKVVGKTVYSLSLSDANGKVTFTGKNVTVTLPYVLKAGESASDVKLFYIDDSNVVHEVVATYDADGKCVVFSTDHFSLWFIDASAAPAPTPTPSSSGGGSNIGLIIGIVVAVLVVAAVAGVVVIKKKKA